MSTNLASEKKDDGMFPSYTLSGFVFAFQVWISFAVFGAKMPIVGGLMDPNVYLNEQSIALVLERKDMNEYGDG
ncbi:hypothetical protein Tco_0347147 [Tanacetum coccineum]